jgi:hypothetical protein
VKGQVPWAELDDGVVHQRLHTAQLFTRAYPTGGRGGNEMCIRCASDRRARHGRGRLLGRTAYVSNSVRTLRNMVTELRSRFPKVGSTELPGATPEARHRRKRALRLQLKLRSRTALCMGLRRDSQPIGCLLGEKFPVLLVESMLNPQTSYRHDSRTPLECAIS